MPMSRESRVGEANGKALAYIAMGETAEQLRQRWRKGDLHGANPQIIRDNLEFRDGRKAKGKSR